MSQAKNRAKRVGKAAGKSAARQTPVAWIIGIAVVAVLAVTALVWYTSQSNTGSSLPQEVSVSQAVKLRDQGSFILDVREPSEWNEFHIPGSTLIPLAELPSRLSELPQDQQIVVVCRSGNRSQSGRDILESAGFENVTSMAGGLNEWRASGFPTVSGP